MNPLGFIVILIIFIVVVGFVSWYINLTLKRSPDDGYIPFEPQETKVETPIAPEVVPVTEEVIVPVEHNRCAICGSPVIWRAWKKNIGWSDATQSSSYQVCAAFFCSVDPASVRTIAGHYGYDATGRHIGFPVDFPEGFYEDFESPTSIPNNG